MSRTGLWAVAGAVTFAAAVALGLFVVTGQDAVDGTGASAAEVGASSTPSPDPSGEFASAASLSQRDADRLAGHLVSGDPHELAEAVVLPDGQDLDPALLGSLRSMELRIDASTFSATGPGTGVVAATSTSQGQDRTWTVDLLRADGQWKVLWTSPRGPS